MTYPTLNADTGKIFVAFWKQLLEKLFSRQWPLTSLLFFFKTCSILQILRAKIVFSESLGWFHISLLLIRLDRQSHQSFMMAWSRELNPSMCTFKIVPLVWVMWQIFVCMRFVCWEISFVGKNLRSLSSPQSQFYELLEELSVYISLVFQATVEILESYCLGKTQ